MYNPFYDFDPFGYSNPFDDAFSIFNGMSFLGVFLLIIMVVIVAVVYFMRGYTLLCMGRKAGLSAKYNWMPFIPCAQAAYRYRILGEADAKLFCWTDYMFYSLIIILSCIFLEIPFLLAFIITALVFLFSDRLAFLLIWFVMMIMCFSIPGMPAGWTVFATVVFLYLCVGLAFRFVYYKKLYKAFNITPLFAMHIFIPGGGIVETIINYIIAFSGNYQMGGRAMQPAGNAPQGYPGPQGYPAPQPYPPQQQPYQQPGGYPQGPQMGPQPGFAPPRGGVITGITGMYRNAIIDVPQGEEIILGRDAAMAHVIIDQDADRVSRRHCGIRYNPQDGSYIVTDYSTNGTFREDGSRMPSNMSVTLMRGATIKLGSSSVSFRLG